MNDENIEIILIGEERKIIRDKAIILADKMKEVFIDFAEIMYIVKNDNLWEKWGYLSFRDYIDRELKLSRTNRTVNYFIEIYDNICIKLNKSKDALRNIPWTNIRELPRLIKRNIITKDNIDDWIDKAKNTNQRQFVINIKKELLQSDIKEEDKDELIYKTFVFRKDQIDNINLAINIAMQMNKSEFENIAIDNICLYFNSRHASNFIREDNLSVLKVILKNIEKEFDVNLLCINNKDEFIHGKFLMLCNLYKINKNALKFLRKNINLYNILLSFHSKVIVEYGLQEFELKFENKNLMLYFKNNCINLNDILDKDQY